MRCNPTMCVNRSRFPCHQHLRVGRRRKEGGGGSIGPTSGVKWVRCTPHTHTQHNFRQRRGHGRRQRGARPVEQPATNPGFPNQRRALTSSGTAARPQRQRTPSSRESVETWEAPQKNNCPEISIFGVPPKMPWNFENYMVQFEEISSGRSAWRCLFREIVAMAGVLRWWPTRRGVILLGMCMVVTLGSMSASTAALVRSPRRSISKPPTKWAACSLSATVSCTHRPTLTSPA
jgi:hypothetical protein